MNTNPFDLRLREAIRNVPDFPKPGIQFKDITPILLDSSLCREVATAVAFPFRERMPDAVMGIESRGFLFGMMMASALGVAFIPARKEGKLPARTHKKTYALEYGSSTIEVHEDAIRPGMRIVIHDDLLATGGTAAAAAAICQENGANVSGFSFLVELSDLRGRERLLTFSPQIESLLFY